MTGLTLNKVKVVIKIAIIGSIILEMITYNYNYCSCEYEKYFTSDDRVIVIKNIRKYYFMFQ